MIGFEKAPLWMVNLDRDRAAEILIGSEIEPEKTSLSNRNSANISTKTDL